MQNDNKSCHGQFDCLVTCSERLNLKTIYKVFWNLRVSASHALWHLKTEGLLTTLSLSLSKILKLKSKQSSIREKEQPVGDAILELQPGELVEVKSREEILATLDENRKNKGLLWMCNMWKFCGKRFRVYKRLERILLESNGEYRTVKNTVLLEGVVCDGLEFYGCDRSCFHFWKEAWLRRVNE